MKVMSPSSCHRSFLRIPPLAAILVAVVMATPCTSAAPGSSAAPGTSGAPALLAAGAFKHYIDTFNAGDDELYANAYPNAKAWDFLGANMPLFECPDEDLERTYYFRWWTFRKHLKETPDGWVITEFLPKVPWSAKHNTINCPAGHHFYEGRWLADPKYLDDYAIFWFRRGGNPRQYSFWAADAIYANYLVKHDRAKVTGLLDDLTKNHEGWEKGHLTPDGLFWQIDDRDGMEVSIGKSGKRATINSYMFGDATAIARIAELAGRQEVAATYQRKAEQLKQLVQTKLWDPQAGFFKTLPRSPYELSTPMNSQDGSVPRLHWMDSEHRGTLEWVQYSFDQPRTFDAVEVYWAEGGPALGKPASWRVLVRKDGAWLPVKNHGGYGVALDAFNKVGFDPVQSDAIRLEVQSAGNQSAGIFEWRVLEGGKNHAADGKISKSFDIRMGPNNSVKALNDGTDAGKEPRLVDVRELHGYTPWYFNLPDAGRGYEVTWKQLMDPRGFLAPFGPTTAEQRHPEFKISYEGHDCQWNGPSWPFATAVTLTAMANVLHNYRQDFITKEDYYKILRIYATSHRRKLPDGRVVPWIDENLDPFTGEWIARKRGEEHAADLMAKGQPEKILRERGKDYNHSTYCDLIITGLVGLRPREDDIIEINPLVPPGQWNYFCLDAVPYHGRILTIIWDCDGKRYGQGAGLQLRVDGQRMAQRPDLGRLSCPTS